MIVKFDPPITPEELMTKLIGDYPREGWRITIDKEIDSPLHEVHPQGGHRAINQIPPRIYERGVIHMKTDTGYVGNDPVGSIEIKGGMVVSVTAYMRDGAKAEKLIRYLGKRLAVVDA
jgi:hypothetical protein